MLKLYGPTRSRAFRVMWLAHEIGLAFEQIPVSIYTPEGEAYQDWFAAINPNQRVPAIDDDGFRLWETGAITLYLAKKYGGDFYPRGAAAEATMLQWAFFTVADLDPPMVTMLQNRMVLAPGERDESRVTSAIATMQKPLGVLDRALARAPFLAGESWDSPTFMSHRC